MFDDDLKQVVRSTLADLFPGGAALTPSQLEALERELLEFVGKQQPGSDREQLLQLVRECVAELRANHPPN